MQPTFEPYYAVVFTSKRTPKDDEAYSQMAIEMESLAKKQPGFIGIESAREQIGITVSYWTSLEAIQNWKRNADHLIAQKKGKDSWYSWYHVRVCKVERSYEFSLENQ